MFNPRPGFRAAAVGVTLAAVAMLASAALSAAPDEVTRSRTLSAAGVASVVLGVGVGEIRVEQGSGDAIEARVTIRAKRNTGIFSSLPDVQKLDLAATMRGDQLTLDVDAKNIEEDWLIRLPKTPLSALELKLGVGDVRVDAAAKRVEVDIGVGDAKLEVPSGAVTVKIGTGDAGIRTPLANAGAIDGKTGVGNVSLAGLDGTVKSSAVGGSVSGRGRGQQALEAKVGVGEVDIVLTE